MQTCLDSVQSWALGRGYAYDFVGDEIFEMLPDWFRVKTAGQPSVASALGRLIAARRHLKDGWDQVIWLDASTLVLDASGFRLKYDGPYAFGREVWVQRATNGDLRASQRINNAVVALRRGNPIVDFYIHACQQLVRRGTPPVAPAMLGSNLLGALHNMLRFPTFKHVARLTHPVIADINSGGGDALALCLRETATTPTAVCLDSSADDEALSVACDRLLSPLGQQLLAHSGGAG